MPSDILVNIMYALVGFCVGIVTCVILGHLYKKNFFGGIFRNLEHIIMLVSMFILLIGLILEGLSITNQVGITYLNIFATVIFSWLLTKLSSKKDFEEQERTLARISYRHIQQTESSITTLTKEITQFLNADSESEKFDTVNKDATEELRNVLSTLEHLKGSIAANKQDWSDKLHIDNSKENSPSESNKNFEVLKNLRDRFGDSSKTGSEMNYPEYPSELSQRASDKSKRRKNPTMREDEDQDAGEC